LNLSPRPVFLSRSLRALVDGAMAVVLPAYLLELGYGTVAVGVIATATLLGSALTTILVGAWGHRLSRFPLLMLAGLLMASTGLAFGNVQAFAPLLVVAFVGTLNPSAGDVSVFLPLEHARIAASASGHERTARFARYSVLGAVCAAIGALASGLPDALVAHAGVPRIEALRAMFLAYAAVGLAVAFVYRRDRTDPAAAPAAPLGPSKPVVVRLAMLFSVDAFAGGMVVNSLLALWLLQKFGLSLAEAGTFFFGSGLLAATSQLAAVRLARRIGLLNTMVFTHIPASGFLILAAFAPTLPAALALLLCRSALSQMDVPTRSAYVMSVVTPAERPAAASFTAVPRSLAAAVSPSIAGALLAMGWLATPLVACSVLKITYDLALWRACRGQPLEASP
jgi:MFS family permease